MMYLGLTHPKDIMTTIVVLSLFVAAATLTQAWSPFQPVVPNKSPVPSSFLSLSSSSSSSHTHHRRSYGATTTTTTTTTKKSSSLLFYGNDGSSSVAVTSQPAAAAAAAVVVSNSSSSYHHSPLHRFHRQASTIRPVDQDCILTIHHQRYNMTAWAQSHPGGSKILLKFHNRDATKAFQVVHHSDRAYAMLQEFLVVPDDENHDHPPPSATVPSSSSSSTTTSTSNTLRYNTTTDPSWQRVRHKLFTKEDPWGVHKYLGIFCLVNFLGRFTQMYFEDPAAGLGSRGHPYFSMACLMPHALLSLSSLIFHTVPRERVVGKPMIWQEYRIHNIVFGLRSILSSWCAALAIRAHHTPLARSLAILSSSACVLLANYAADQATWKLRVVDVESTTATMPYWEGCSVQTQQRFKSFYAYSQFMATLTCLACGNPAWPLAILFPIQLASLLMTLVRKGLLSTKGLHLTYTASLILPYLVAFRSMWYTKTYEFPLMLAVGYVLYQLRRHGVSKYALWIPVILSRGWIGDQFIAYAAW
jgi:hypothetical protein